MVSMVKNSPANVGDMGDVRSIPGLGRSLEKERGVGHKKLDTTEPTPAKHCLRQKISYSYYVPKSQCGAQALLSVHRLPPAGSEGTASSPR